MGLTKPIRTKAKRAFYRTLYPDTFNDDNFRGNLEALKAKVAGRSVALVGNAESIFVRADGKDIDACDLVMRMNKGFIHEAGSQGARTDILCLSLRLSFAEISREFGDVAIVYGNQDRWVMSKDMWAKRNSIAYYPLDEFHALSALIGGYRPSTGLMAIDLLANLLKAADIRLFGFDWKQTKTYYEATLNYNVHDWQAERELVNKWARRGRVILPPGQAPTGERAVAL